MERTYIINNPGSQSYVQSLDKTIQPKENSNVPKVPYNHQKTDPRTKLQSINTITSHYTQIPHERVEFLVFGNTLCSTLCSSFRQRQIERIQESILHRNPHPKQNAYTAITNLYLRMYNHGFWHEAINMESITDS